MFLVIARSGRAESDANPVSAPAAQNQTPTGSNLFWNMLPEEAGPH